MKLKLAQIVESKDALSNLLNERLSIKAAYALQRNVQKLNPELETYEKSRVELIKNKHGVMQEDGNYAVKKENAPAFIEDLNELLSVEVDVDIHKVNLSELKEISAADLLILEWMFTDDLAVEEKKPARKPRKKSN